MILAGGIDNSLSILELFTLIQEIINLPEIAFANIAHRQSDQEFFIADISKAVDWFEWSLPNQ